MTVSLTGEIWKPVDDYDQYEISNFGRIKSSRRGKPKILRPAPSNGYYRVELSGSGVPKRKFYIHRLVAEAFCPKSVGRDFVNHIDGDRKNNLHTNLEWVTPEENTRHAWDNGFCEGVRKRAKQNKNTAKLTQAQADEIRLLYATGMFNQTELGMRFGVGQDTVSLIVRNKIWKHDSSKIELCNPS